MKALILTFALIFLGTTFSIAASHPTKQIHQYKRVQKQTIELPTNFAKPFIIEQKDMDLLAGKTIHHVELVYTKYAESANFNQKALNNRRIAQLKKLLPQVNSDNPEWTWLEQTGAKTRDVANGYFHGFVIHYGDKLDHVELGKFFSDFAGNANQLSINSSTGGSFKIASGTTIHVPANAVSYKNGKKVEGDFILSYTEYRDQAEIAFSGLPMYYQGDNFSSVGMYELRGEKDGKELKLNKAITVDFNCTEVVDDAGFFSMNDETGEWKKEKDLEFSEQTVSPEKPVVAAKLVSNMTWAIRSGAPSNSEQYIKWLRIDDETMEAILDSTAWRYNKGLDESKTLLGIIEKNSDKQSYLIERGSQGAFQRRVANRVYYKGEYNADSIQAYQAKQQAYWNKQRDASFHYSTIVSGLRSPSFGVYNCDQVYRMRPVAQISPIYKDAETNKRIENGYIACVIDKTKNASFSFSPSYLSVGKNGRNNIVLFTLDKEIYLIDEKAFSKLNLDKGQTIKMRMRNVTSEIKSPSDLKRMLNI